MLQLSGTVSDRFLFRRTRSGSEEFVEGNLLAFLTEAIDLRLLFLRWTRVGYQVIRVPFVVSSLPTQVVGRLYPLVACVPPEEVAAR